jgi:hypothetical protein
MFTVDQILAECQNSIRGQIESALLIYYLYRFVAFLGITINNVPDGFERIFLRHLKWQNEMITNEAIKWVGVAELYVYCECTLLIPFEVRSK